VLLLHIFGLLIWDASLFLCGQGSWRLRPHENAIIQGALQLLPTQAGNLFRQQLKQRYFVERSGGRINTLRFYRPSTDLRVSDPEWSKAVIDVHIDVEGEKQKAQVTTHDGLIFEVQLRKKGREYRGRVMRVLDVRRGSLNRTITRSIDQAEHGGGDALP
jgi:hypothetical protein